MASTNDEIWHKFFNLEDYSANMTAQETSFEQVKMEAQLLHRQLYHTDISLLLFPQSQSTRLLFPQSQMIRHFHQ